MSRTRFRGRRPAVTRRERFWVTKNYEPAPHSNNHTQAFSLLSSEDYLGGDSATLVDRCTVLRSVGSLFVDPIIDQTPGFSAIGYSAAIGVVSEEALQNAIGVDFSMSQYDPNNIDFPRRVRILRHFGRRSFVESVFSIVVGVGDERFMPVYTADGQIMGVEWDITQKARLKTDEALWLFVNATATNSQGEGNDWATEAFSRVLYAT